MVEETLTQPIGEVHGIFTKDMIDTEALYRIDSFKNDLLMNLDKTNPNDRIEKLQNLFSLMQSKLEKYFDKQTIVNTRIKLFTGEYNFYDAKGAITEAEDLETARDICEVGFTCYDLLLKKIGVALPTMISDPKKKLIQNLFSLVKKKNPEAFIERLLAEYKYTGVQHSNNNLLCFCISQAYKFDLDVNILNIGFARIGKSTLFYQQSRRVFAFRNGFKTLAESDVWLIKRNFSSENVVYSSNQNLRKMLKEKEQDMIGSDEGYLTADKREAMVERNIHLGQDINAFANKNNIFCTSIQNLADLDTRFINKANIIQLITERGTALVYCKGKNFPIMKDSFGFERFIKYPRLLSNLELGSHHLKKLPSFIFEIKYAPLDNCQSCSHYNHNKKICALCKCSNYIIENALFETYIKNKKIWQKELN